MVHAKYHICPHNKVVMDDRFVENRGHKMEVEKGQPFVIIRYGLIYRKTFY